MRSCESCLPIWSNTVLILDDALTVKFLAVLEHFEFRSATSH
jgi:hypothetical protein